MPTPVDPDALRPGTVFSRGVFTRRGARLVAPGVPLSPPMCHALNERATERVAGELRWNLYLADSPLDFSRHPLDDPLNPDAPQRPADDEREIARLRATRARAAGPLISDLLPSWNNLPRRVQPAESHLDPVADDGIDWPDAERLSAYRETRIDRIAALHDALLRGEPIATAQPAELIHELTALYWRFPGHFAQLADVEPHARIDDPEIHAARMQAVRAPNAARRIHAHAWATTVYTVLIASTMKWEPEDTRIAALAALFADIGMHLLPPKTANAARPLTDTEINRLWRHPAISVSFLEQISDLPEAVRLAVYQHHERDDGSGYPQRTERPRISDHARLLAVADAYAAASTPRPHRPGKHRYPALNEIADLASLGVLDRPAARALARAVGIFPVAATVRLSTGELARVIANNPAMPDRPSVRVLRRQDDRLVPGARLDLAEFEPWAISVVGPADDPARHWVRPRQTDQHRRSA